MQVDLRLPAPTKSMNNTVITTARLLAKVRSSGGAGS